MYYYLLRLYLLVILYFLCIYTGKFCAIWWPESLYYVVIEVVAQDTNRMREVDRGQCYSVGWTTYAGERKEALMESDDDDEEEEEKGEAVKSTKNSVECKEEEEVEAAKSTENSVESKDDLEHGKDINDGVTNEKNNDANNNVVGEDKNEINDGLATATSNTTASKQTPKPKQVFTETVPQSIDMCTFITPQKQITSGKENKWGFFKKSKDKGASGGGGVLPSMMLMKDFHSVDNPSQPTEIVTPTGCPDDFSHVFGGGPLICITSKIVSKDAANSNAVSQIELAAAALLEEASHSGNNTNHMSENIIEIPPYATHKSQFYYLSIDELSEKRNVADKFVLTPLGPAMATVSMVSWDILQTTQFTSDGADIYTQRVAILIENRINILVMKGITTVATGRQNRTRSRSSSKYKKQSSMSVLFSAAPVLDKISLSCVASCQVGALPYDTPTNLFWDNGTLFAATPSAVHAIFPLAQAANRADSNDERGNGERDDESKQNDEHTNNSFSNCFQDGVSNRHGHLVQWGGSMAESFLVSSLHSLSPSASWHTANPLSSTQSTHLLPQMLAMPYGHVEVVGVSRGYLMLAMRDSSIAAVPLTVSPMVRY
jgi:hypothetical protein